MRCSTMLLTVLMTTLLLSGCAGGMSNDSPVRNCPVPRTYSRAQQNQWANEVIATPKGSMYRMITDDYISLRDQARDCWGKH